MEKDEDLQIRHILQGRVGKRKRDHSAVMDMINVGASSENEDEGLSESDAEADETQSPRAGPLLEGIDTDVPHTQEIDETPTPVINVPAVVGSALRRNEDGTAAAPIVRSRSRAVTLQSLLSEIVLTRIIDWR